MKSTFDLPLGLTAVAAALAVGCDHHTVEAAPDTARREVVDLLEPTADVDYATAFAEVGKGETDPLSIPPRDGVVWYGTWEDAVVESQRTNKPIMLHFGSPRCPGDGDVCVPGTW